MSTLTGRIFREYPPLEICDIPFPQRQPLYRRIQEATHGLLATTELHFASKNFK